MTMTRRFLLSISALVVLTISACSSPSADTPEPTADPTAAATPVSTADPTDAATEAPVASEPATDPWSVNAVEHRAQGGEEFTYDCPSADEERIDSVWGTEVYTDDSSVCSAAVHAGAIDLDDGGEVTIEITAGEDSYEGTEQNGVESLDYGPWGGSFIIVDD